MSSEFSALRNKAVISAFVGSVGGLVLWTTSPNALSRNIGAFIAIGSIGSLAATQFVTDSAESIHERVSKQIHNNVTKLTNELRNERSQTTKITKELETKNQLVQQLTEDLTKLYALANAFEAQLKQAKQEIESATAVNSESAVELLNDSLEDFREQITNLISVLTRRYPDIRDWETLVNDFENHLEDFKAQIGVVSDLTNAPELIESSLAVQHGIIYRGSLLKVRAYKSVCTYLQSILSGVISIEEHQEKLQTLAQNYQKNLDAVREEYGLLVDTASSEFSQHLSEICQQGMTDAETIEALKTEIYRQQQLLVEAKKPHKLPGTSEPARVANSIIDYYYRCQITLDGLDWQTSETGYTLMFHTDRNGSRFISAEDLNDGHNPEKIKELSGAINLPKFEPSTHSCYLKLEIIRSPKKKGATEDDIKLMIGTAEDFIKYVTSHPIRYRLIADPGRGKTPTTAVMISEILKTGCTRGNTGKGEKVPHTLVTVSYPDAESSLKDADYPLEMFLRYGNTTAAVKSFEDCLKDGQYRTRNTRYASEFFQIWVWDEFDNTINSSNDPQETGNSIKHILKQFGHKNIGWIVSGQSVMTKQLPGFTNDDRTLFTEIIIDIPKIRKYLKTYGSETLSERIIEALRNNLDKIEEYVEAKNQLITDDARLLRVALILDSRSPKLYFLPNLEYVNIDAHQVNETRRLAELAKADILTDATDQSLTQNLPNSCVASTDQNDPRSSFPLFGGAGQNDQNPVCPHCGSPKLKILSDKRYCCNDCKRRFVESKLVWK
jgi:hypothetical protein